MPIQKALNIDYPIFNSQRFQSVQDDLSVDGILRHMFVQLFSTFWGECFGCCYLRECGYIYVHVLGESVLRGGGTTIQPRRHPVMLKYLEKLLITMAESE